MCSISDYFIIGGMGAAMLNAGLVTLASLLLTRRLELTYSGLSVAAILIMGGFALFGKNLVNCLPILFGNWLFARYQEEKWNKYIVIGLFSTCLAPFVSFLYNALSTALWLRVAAAAGIGVVIGFVVPALAPHTASFHMGYNLFNVGFAAGFVAIALMSVLRGFQLDSGSVMIWQKGFPPLLTGLCLGALVLLFVWGWLLSDRELRRLGRITRHSGRAVADFVFMDGVGPTFMNMAVMGLLTIGWLWLVGGDLNGPTLGGVITIMGFAAFGMHPKNCAPIVAGISAATLLLRYQPADPSHPAGSTLRHGTGSHRRTVRHGVGNHRRNAPLCHCHHRGVGIWRAQPLQQRIYCRTGGTDPGAADPEFQKGGMISCVRKKSAYCGSPKNW